MAIEKDDNTAPVEGLRTDGELAVELIKGDFAKVLQDILEKVQPFGNQAIQLGEDFIGFDLEEGDLNNKASAQRSIRVYWYAYSSAPRVCVSFAQLNVDSSMTYFMCEATNGRMAWWYPQASNIDETFAILEQAFTSGKLNLEQLQIFVNEIREIQSSIEGHLAGNLLNRYNPDKTMLLD